jgi:MFS family permease
MAIGFVLGGQGVQRRHASFVLTASLVLIAAGSLGFVLGGGHLVAYFAARLLMGIGSGGLWIGVTSATLERFPGQKYRRLAGVLAAYSVGGIADAGLGAVGGIRSPFLLYLALVLAAGAVVRFLGRAQRAPSSAPTGRCSARDSLFPVLGFSSLRSRSAPSRARSAFTSRLFAANERSQRSTSGSRSS